MNKIDEAWIRDYLEPRYPELVRPYREVIAMSDAAHSSGRLTEGEIASLIEYAHDPRSTLSSNVASKIGKLADRFASARSAIRSLSKDKILQCRINSLVALESHALSELHHELVPRLLRDKSSRVRLLAASKIGLFRLTSLIPQLAEAAESEKAKTIREQLTWELEYASENLRLRALALG